MCMIMDTMNDRAASIAVERTQREAIGEMLKDGVDKKKL